MTGGDGGGGDLKGVGTVVEDLLPLGVVRCVAPARVSAEETIMEDSAMPRRTTSNVAVSSRAEDADALLQAVVQCTLPRIKPLRRSDRVGDCAVKKRICRVCRAAGAARGWRW